MNLGKINKSNDLVNEEKVLIEMFNIDYINIAQKTASLAPKTLGNSISAVNFCQTVSKIIKH